jgi:hypothetical protein
MALPSGDSGVSDDTNPSQLPARAKSILDKAVQFHLYSLGPESESEAEHREPVKDGFRARKVLGTVVVKDPQVRKQILRSLYDGIAETDGNGSRCFDPRHGIRASVDGKAVDLVICFECNWVYVFFDKHEQRQGVACTTRKPQATFDKVLKDARVPLAKPAKK